MKLSEKREINAPIEQVYRQLADPFEQVRWNTLYLDVAIEPKGEIRTGTVMTGTFKGSGKATVHFENVVLNKEFTHYSKLLIFGFINLGEFRHTYTVDRLGPDKTLFTQTVNFEPKGLGKLMKNVVMNGFKKRLPESFSEFKQYAETTQS
ncbi:SRPBCC family protein [Spirosoma areae]